MFKERRSVGDLQVGDIRVGDLRVGQHGNIGPDVERRATLQVQAHSNITKHQERSDLLLFLSPVRRKRNIRSMFFVIKPLRPVQSWT